jgi:hypothetical protein
MLGCRINLRMCISRVTRSTSDTSIIRDFSSILIATGSPVNRCVADLTLPKVPSPRV